MFFLPSLRNRDFFRLFHEENGATSLEYAMIAMLVSLVALLAYVVMVNVFDDNYMTLVGGMANQR